MRPILMAPYLKAVVWLRSHLGSADVSGLRQALAEGADPNGQDAQGWTGLILCSLTDNVAAARVLLEAGADANLTTQSGFGAFMWASWYQADGVAAELGKKGYAPGLCRPKTDGAAA